MMFYQHAELLVPLPCPLLGIPLQIHKCVIPLPRRMPSLGRLTWDAQYIQIAAASRCEERLPLLAHKRVVVFFYPILAWQTQL